MWPFKSAPKASPKRVAELEEQITDVLIALAWCKKAIVDLNARMATLSRRSQPAAPQPADENGDEQPPPETRPAPPAIFPTAHLSKRFRSW